jgi:hypothetical protein
MDCKSKKIPYLSENEAKAQFKHFRDKYKTGQKRIVYKCDYCSMYHITHRSKVKTPKAANLQDEETFEHVYWVPKKRNIH